ncbi:MAG: 2-oxo acid dehydrogenase subunit E2 [Anaerolineaceae bacterium]|nr:MAG: 2-oxo acid dehydrogenase subunit E2 [Anaerolineaceae bacterium]
MATKVIMPKLEMAQESATIIEWLKREGDQVEKGEPLLVIETDKVTVELESPGSGLLSSVRGDPGEEIPVTKVIAYLLEPGEEPPEEIVEEEIERVSEAPPPPILPLPSVEVTPVAKRLAASHGIDLGTVVGTGPKGQITKEDVEAALAAPVAVTPPGKIRATPSARRLAREKGVDLAAVKGTGPRGQVTAEDVEAYSPAPGIVGLTPLETVPLRGIRRTIAERMTHSYQTTPHIFVSLRVDMSKLEVERARLNEESEANEQPRISVTAILVKVTADVLKDYPWLNSTLQGEEVVLISDLNIGVAVALDGGLIAPVVHDADRKGVAEIGAEVQDLATRARNNQLTPSDVARGTFTISNLGPFGIDQFTAIINPPNAAILAVGAIRPEVVVDEEGEIVVRPLAWMTLAADHRIVDGAVAAQFLTALKEALEDPAQFLG